jgi:hypothetical protein
MRFNPFRVGEREDVLPLAAPGVTEITPLTGLAYPVKAQIYIWREIGLKCRLYTAFCSLYLSFYY